MVILCNLFGWCRDNIKDPDEASDPHLNLDGAPYAGELMVLQGLVIYSL